MKKMIHMAVAASLVGIIASCGEKEQAQAPPPKPQPAAPKEEPAPVVVKKEEPKKPQIQSFGGGLTKQDTPQFQNLSGELSKEELGPQKPEFPSDALELEKHDRQSPIGNAKLEFAIKAALQHQQFDEFSALLAKELYAPLKDRRDGDKYTQQLIKTPGWNHALHVYTLLKKISKDRLSMILEEDTSAPDFYLWLFTHPSAVEQFVTNVTPYDNTAKALDLWQQIYFAEKEELRDKYLNLAIATILVHDTPRKVKSNDYNKLDIKAVDRYSLFRKNAEEGRLKTRLSAMPVSDLIWVIDVPISDEEIEWAVKKANFRRSKWGRSYGHIEYLMERAVEGKNPYDAYTFEQIEKHGGICGDQTYFSSNTAKANGIPATGVTGTGDRGGHAWLAYKPDDDEWDTSTGRYENYTNGSFTHPQTDQRFAEFDLMLLSDRKMQFDDIQDSRRLLRAARMLEANKHDRTAIKVLLEKAISTAPMLEEAWLDYVAFLEAATEPETSVTEWKQVVSKIERTFKKHPTMWLTARDITIKHILKGADKKTIGRSQDRFRDELARRFPKRSDLIRKVLQDQEAMWAEEPNFTHLRSFYREAFRHFGADTINFKFIAGRYYLASQEFPKEQARVVDDIENYFDRSIDQKSTDYFKAKTEIGIITMIAGYYKEIGEFRKAEKFYKEAEKRKKKSKRKAL